MAFINRDDITLHYQWLNQRHDQTIVFINSLGTHLAIWSEVVDQLQGQFNILLFDKRGHGLSSTKDGVLHIDDYADDVIFLMDSMQIDRAHVVGLSIGGMITYSLGSRYSDRLDKLVFSNTGAKIGTMAGWTDRINSVQRDGLDSISGVIIKRWLSPRFRAQYPTESLGYKNMLERNSVLGYVQACAAIRDADFNPILKEITHPCLFIGGAADVGTPPTMVTENAKNLGAQQIEILDEVGHLPCIEAPEEVVRILRMFLSDPLPTTLEASFIAGMKTRRSVLGNAHVDRAESNKTAFDRDFQDYIVHSAWSAVWSRPHLTRRERSMITVALLVALGHQDELAMHLRATRHTGATKLDIQEVLLHTAVYAGVPVTNRAMKIAKEIFENINPRNGE